MARISWHSAGDNVYETGVDRGVLYVGGLPGVPWNGLVSVEHGSSGAAVTPHYFNGVRFYNELANEEFYATITAFTYPDEFALCDGSSYDSYGIGFTEQDRQPFGLVYRTGVGDDLRGIASAYKLHVVYNATAIPSAGSAYESMGSDINLTNFAWNISTIPESFETFKPTAHLVLDSRKISPSAMEALEDGFYGTSSEDGRLLTLGEIVSTIVDKSGRLRIIPNTTSGIGVLIPMTGSEFGQQADLTGKTDKGIYTLTTDTRLSETGNLGLYTLE